MMRRAGRHNLICWIILAASLTGLPGWASIRDADSKASKIPDGRMRHIRSSGLPYVATFSNNATMELWQYRDPAVGFVQDIVPRRLIVGMKPGLTRVEQDAALSVYSQSRDYSFPLLAKHDILVLDVKDITSAAELAEAKATLEQNPDIEFVMMDGKYDVQLTPNDPDYASQWHHQNIRSSAAWDIVAGQSADRPVVLAVIDTGVSLRHEDLAEAIWINEGEIPGDGIDNDRNGFVDDVNGWDFSDGDNDPDPGLWDDYLYHGTHVAGCAAAIANNGIGVAGTGYRLTIMPLKVFPYSFDSTIASAVIYASNNGADILNLSLGRFGYSPVMEFAFRIAHQKGIGIVVSAGNDDVNTDVYPVAPVNADGDDNYVLGVAATDSDDVRADFSNFGTRYIDIAAPGVDVLSTIPGNEYEEYSGTSMAAPVVAGVLGLLKAYRPDYPIHRLYAAITDYADNINALNPGYRGLLGGGRLNSLSALQNADVAGLEFEAEPNDDFLSAGPLVGNATIDLLGAIDPQGDKDMFSFSGRAGEIYEVEIFAKRFMMGGRTSELQPYLTLYAPDQITVLREETGTAGLSGDAMFRQRLPQNGTYYIKVEDKRNRPPALTQVGGPDFFYHLQLRHLIQHSQPVTNLISPFSPPTSVIGIDLVDRSAAVYLEEITVRIETAPGSTGRIEPSDFKPMTVDEFSGVAFYRDGKGPTEGGFDFTDNQKQDDDLLIKPTEQPILRMDPENPGAFEVTLRLFDPRFGPDPNPLTFIPADSDLGLFDFFVVVRTSGSLSHDESFFITIPPDGLKAVSQQTTLRVPFADQGFGANSYPAIPQTIFGEAIRFVNYTDAYNTIEQAVDVASDPVPMIGIDAVSPANDALYLERVTVTILGIRPTMSFLNVPNDNIFDRLDLAPLTGDANSGVALYRDSSEGGKSGTFDKDVDILIPLDTSKLQFTEIPATADALSAYVVTLVPRDDVITNRRNLLELPPNNGDPNDGSDFFIVIRTSDRIRDGDTFRVEVRTDLETGEGGIVLANGSDRLYTRREATLTSVPPVYNVTARPKPRFFLTDLTGTGLSVKKESIATAVIGIDAVDFGANQLNSDGDTFGWYFDTISIDFLDLNGDGDFTIDDLRPISSNVSRDALKDEYNSGVAIYMDDSTPIEDGIDDDGDGLIDEELFNGIDDDRDGLVDEDCGDDDPAGLNGVFDGLDDYIPFYIGSADKEIDPNNPRFPGTGRASPHEGHNFNLRIRSDNQSYYPVPPLVSELDAENGFRVTFRMVMNRVEEIHPCSSGRTVAVLNEPFGQNFARAGELPMIGLSGATFPTELKCNDNPVGFVWDSEGMGLAQTGPSNQWCCIQDPGNSYRLTYNYVLEIPDDNEGPNKGDDFFVVIRTSNTISDGDDFRVRMDTGSITYRNYKEIFNFNLAPGANDTRLITNTVTASVPINLRLNDLTKFQQRVDPLISPSDLPLEVLGLNADVAADEAEQPQPGFSDEAITSFVLELVDETPPTVELEPNNTRAAANLIYLGDTARGEILTMQDADYYSFTAPSGVTRAKMQPWAESFTTLVIKAEVQNATGQTLVQAAHGQAVEFAVQPGVQYWIKVSTSETLGYANKSYTILTWSYSTLYQEFMRRGFHVSNNPNLSDLAPFSSDTSSGIAVYIDSGTQEGRFEPIGANPDRLVGLSDTTPDIEIAGKGTESDPFVYRVKILLSDELPIPFDDFGASAGSDFYIVIRPSDKITFGDAFRVRLKSKDIQATASIVPVEGETNRLTANVPTVIHDLTSAGQLIYNGLDAALPTATAIFGLDINDGVGGDEKLVQLKLRFLRGSAGTFTINDILPIKNSIDSGVALYRNVGDRERFDVNEDIFIPVQGGFSGSLATLAFTAGGGADVPDDNVGENAGDDYYIVIRTSENIRYETPGSPGNRFSVEIPIDDGIRYTSGFVKKTERTEELIPASNAGPTFQMLVPNTMKERPIDGLYTLIYAYSDPDNDLQLEFFISPAIPDGGGLAANAVEIPDSVQTLPASVGQTVDFQTFAATIPNGTGIQDLARRTYGLSIAEVFVAGRLTEVAADQPSVNPALVAYATGSWDVSGATSSAHPVVSVVIDNVNMPSQAATITYSLYDSDSAATGVLYLGAAGFLNEASGVPNADAVAGVDYLVLDEFATERRGELFQNQDTFSFAQLRQGVYRAYVVGKDNENAPVIASSGLIVTITDPRWPIRVQEPVKAAPLLADVHADAMKELLVVTSGSRLYIFNEVGSIVVEKDLVQAGITGAPFVESSPALIDLNPTDNYQELLVAVSEYNSSNKPLAALYLIPIDRTGTTAETILPSDKVQRLVLFSATTNLNNPAIVSTPAIADIDLDGASEAVIATGQGELVAVNLTPQLSVQWRVSGLKAIQCSPAVGNVDDDPLPEIIVYTDDGKLYILKSPAEGAGAPVLPAPVLSVGTQANVYAVAAYSPSLGDVDGDGKSEIIIGTPSSSTVNGRLYIVNGDYDPSDNNPPFSPVAVDPETKAAFTVQGQITTAPALADLDGDGRVDIVLLSALEPKLLNDPRGKVYAFGVDTDAGQLKTLFVHDLRDTPTSSPVIADYNPARNIFFGLKGGKLESLYWNPVTSAVTRTPQKIAGRNRTVYDYGPLGDPSEAVEEIYAPPALGDLNCDGTREVAYVTNSQTFALVNALQSDQGVSITAPPLEDQWPAFKHDNYRTGDIRSPLGMKLRMDVTKDGVVDYRDLFLLFANDWHGVGGPTQPSAVRDLPGEDLVDHQDLILFMHYWHK